MDLILDRLLLPFRHRPSASAACAAVIPRSRNARRIATRSSHGAFRSMLARTALVNSSTMADLSS